MDDPLLLLAQQFKSHYSVPFDNFRNGTPRTVALRKLIYFEKPKKEKLMGFDHLDCLLIFRRSFID